MAALEPKIKESLEIIRVDIENFLRNTEPPEWDIPSFVTDTTVSEFLRNVKIPAYQNGCPSLLFHNLKSHNDEVVNRIFVRGKHM